MLKRIFLDIETSGLDPEKDFIAEIGMVIADKSCLEHKDCILSVLSCYNRTITVFELNEKLSQFGVTVAQHSMIVPPLDFEELACRDAFNINGLNFHCLKKETTRSAAIASFKSCFSSKYKYKIIGHNVYFEYSFLEKHVSFDTQELNNISWEDTLRLSKKIVPKFPSHKLIYLCKRFKLWNDDITAHSAIVDSILTALLYYHLMRLNKK